MSSEEEDAVQAELAELERQALVSLSATPWLIL